MQLLIHNRDKVRKDAAYGFAITKVKATTMVPTRVTAIRIFGMLHWKYIKKEALRERDLRQYLVRGAWNNLAKRETV